MDQIFVTKYSEDHISHDKNPVVVSLVFVGYIVIVIGMWFVLKKCFDCCTKKNENTNTNNLQYVSLNTANHPTYQSNSLV